MGFGSWLKRATTIPKSPRGILGNLAKNISPFLALTGVGALGSGAVAALGEKIRNPKAGLKDLARAGITNAGLGKGVQGLAKFAQGAGGASAGVPATGAPPVPTPGVPAPAGIPTSLTPSNATAALQGAPAGGGGITAALNTPPALNQPGFLSRISTAVDKYPTAAAMGLNAASNVLTSGSENAMNDAQTDLLRQRFDETEEERRRRAATDAFFRNGSLSLAPLPSAPTGG